MARTMAAAVILGVCGCAMAQPLVNPPEGTDVPRSLTAEERAWILGRVSTGVGTGGTAGASYTDADPSGLAKINIWLDNGLVNNTGEHVYGGDLKGNMWRFNIGGAAASCRA